MKEALDRYPSTTWCGCGDLYLYFSKYKGSDKVKLRLLCTVLVSFYHQLDTTESNLGRGNLKVGIVQIRLACGHHCERLSWWMTDVQGLNLLWVEPSLGRVGLVYTGKLTYHEQVTQSTLSFCPDFPRGKSSIDCDLVSVNELFPPSCCFWSEWLITATEKKSSFYKWAKNTKGRKGDYRKLWLISSEAWL